LAVGGDVRQGRVVEHGVAVVAAPGTVGEGARRERLSRLALCVAPDALVVTEAASPVVGELVGVLAAAVACPAAMDAVGLDHDGREAVWPIDGHQGASLKSESMNMYSRRA